MKIPVWEIANWLIQSCRLSIAQARSVRLLAIELYTSYVQKELPKKEAESRRLARQGAAQADGESTDAKQGEEVVSRANTEGRCHKCGRAYAFCGCEIDPNQLNL